MPAISGDRLTIKNYDGDTAAAEIHQKTSGATNIDALYIRHWGTSGTGRALVVRSDNPSAPAFTIDTSTNGEALRLNGPLVIAAVPGAVNPSTLPLGDSAQARNTGIMLVGSYASDDISGGTDSTPRINIYAYQRASANHFGEVMRNFLMRWDSKAMLTWFGPQVSGTQNPGYDGNGDALTTGVSWNSWAWLGAHYEANDHNSVHGHISLEVPDSTGAMQTRLEVLFADRTTGVIGLEKTFIITNQADLVVRCSSSQELRLAASDANERPITFSTDSFGASSGRRFKIRTTSTASDFEIVRYDDTGTAVDGPIFITRSTGQVLLGTSSGAGVVVRRSNASSGSPALQVQANTAGGTGIEVQTQSNTSRVFQALVSGDANRRFYIDTDGQMLWGPGSATQDTNLYRTTTDVLKTDDSLVVATRLSVGSSSIQTPRLHSTSDGTIEAARFVTTADGTASLGTVVINPNSTSKRALDVRLAADSTSRLRFDFSAATGNGTISFGDGTNTDVNLYRNAANVLKTDDKFIAALGIGVGNAAAATTPGTVTNKIEVFDATGASLGFVPVYNAIT